MKKMVILVSSGLALSAAAYGFTADHSAPETAITREVIRPVKLFDVVNTSHGVTRRFPARVHAAEEAQIAFRVPGEIMELPVRKAQLVKKGDLLAKLDVRDFENEVALRQADFDLANLNYRRIRSLSAQKAISQAELDSATANLKSAEASLKLARDRLKDSTLLAPFDGRIAHIDVENRQLVQSHQPVLLLQDNKALEVHIQLPENILSTIQRDNINNSYKPLVSFTSAPDKTYPVSYKEHATSVTTGTLSYEVTFSMPAPQDITVYPGMGATLYLNFSEALVKAQVSDIIIPVSAVLKDDSTGKHQVWIYQPEQGRITPVEVTLGSMTQKGITILSGLEGGEQIVAAGLSQLRAGMKVRPLVRERGL